MKSVEYRKKIFAMVDEIFENQKSTLETITSMVAECIERGNVINIFGCGHSHIFAEEAFYRAGGLACINPILEPCLMLHEGAAKSSQLERMNDLGNIVYNNFTFNKGDMLFVFSTSGRNPVSIDMVLNAKKQGIITVAVTSLKYSNAYPSRHISGKKLYEIADYYIDNLCETGDAVIEIDGLNTKIGPASTAVGVIILNSILIDASEILALKGIDVPVFKSGNIDGADKMNNELISRYKNRVKLY